MTKRRTSDKRLCRGDMSLEMNTDVDEPNPQISEGFKYSKCPNTPQIVKSISSERPSKISSIGFGTTNGDVWDLTGFGNRWHPEFSVYRTLNFDKLHRDDLDIFWDPGEPAYRSQVDVVGSFCRGVTLGDVTSGQGNAGVRRSVWLDERTCMPGLKGGGEQREHENPMTATGLYRALKMQRFGHEGIPDAARQLIYISDLDPACIHALAATTTIRQIPVLRKAIYKHLHFQASMAVNCGSAGLLAFELELHLPFFIIRDTPPEEPTGATNTKPTRSWTDLSLLDLEVPPSQGMEPKKCWGMYEAHVSCVVTGYDDWRWVAYGFSDTEIDGVLQEESEDDLNFDPIAYGGEVEADIPIWRPRDYWLKVFEVRINQMTEEWEYLIHKVEIGVKRCATKHSSTLYGRSGIAQEEHAEMNDAFDWTTQTIELLGKFDGVLPNTIEKLKAFFASDGDMNYFRDTDGGSILPQSQRSLNNIKATLLRLQDIQKKIEILNKRCYDFKGNLQLRLLVVGKETADGTGSTSEFTVSVLYPIALTAAIFSMQPKAIPFEINPRAFGITSLFSMVALFAIRLFIKHALSRWILLGKETATWIIRQRPVKTSSDASDTRPRMLGDEEHNALGTRVIRGTSSIELDEWGH